MNWRQGLNAAGGALFLPALVYFASDAEMLPSKGTQTIQEFHQTACASADFAESRNLVGPLKDFIELRRTTKAGEIRVLIHQDPEQRLGMIVRRTKPDAAEGYELEERTFNPGNDQDDFILKIWQKSAEINVPVWPMPSSGPVHFQFKSATMMNSTCFEWFETIDGDPAESELSRFAREVFAQVPLEADVGIPSTVSTSHGRSTLD